ncbi:MAG: hypothetical protein A2268_11765 [Candidatus Raymondbacteria bacterium RifOxyA12_full_50_37]|uniref:CopG family transcriptional regulator n=1 Tax=Candidatus Raymondbacteria bacterium RIFOXYD12_FULL_49_13 TaxID=1817890 RepID=A0A1F7FLV5_UNCRA|nr:MAG: hypothetical protein A2268_11765 [Candidatus Raymondbacteria bacterium RifOxyA12_full_50_37]OGJ98734.1 MAG: hypothetical protein A2453_08280 [Candidatus Raymondbacteria bacterium RIFOXYC2_FULL_50_21]OGK07452.1 MAG: hypothetical protein A2519_11175 [Candidatus Raymondbacteria bacterium RIFOXYD12_FULL_49_13]OGK07819.1 MAG: hypothetical protein A2487_00200 [Candidatus Raymondbacteria bacterium RifOxyC12_full_50_8]OGP43897.1 MAG: hypothetical protein A2324_05235 [Candidatus Raymondbacteria 
MAQLSLYIDDVCIKKLRGRARKERTTVSGWVSARIRRLLENEWPDGYFSLYGKVGDASFKRPRQPLVSADQRRAAL